ncbi:MAG: hypothetical protein B7Z55_06900, partial [Planctomycetales bacterium 12-60-4]
MADDFNGSVDPINHPPLAAGNDESPQETLASPQPLTDSDFLTAEVHGAPGENPNAALSAPDRLPGPGLPESLAWTFGLLTMHLAAGIVMTLVILGLMVLAGDLNNGIGDFMDRPDHMLILVGGGQMLVLLLSFIAASFRFSGRLGRTLNLSLPHPLHALIIIGLMLPLSSVSGGV